MDEDTRVGVGDELSAVYETEEEATAAGVSQPEKFPPAKPPMEVPEADGTGEYKGGS